MSTYKGIIRYTVDSKGQEVEEEMSTVVQWPAGRHHIEEIDFTKWNIRELKWGLKALNQHEVASELSTKSDLLEAFREALYCTQPIRLVKKVPLKRFLQDMPKSGVYVLQ